MMKFPRSTARFWNDNRAIGVRGFVSCVADQDYGKLKTLGDVLKQSQHSASCAIVHFYPHHIFALLLLREREASEC